MEALIAIAIGTLTASGVYLMLRQRTFPVIIGLTLLSYAVNVFIFAAGRIVPGLPAIIAKDAAGYTDPLPQALVLTAIVISFGMTAVIVLMALGSWLEAGHDKVDMTDDDGDGQMMHHWIIVPVVLPAILAPLIILIMRYDLTLQRVFALAGTLALLAVAVALMWSATSHPGRGLSPWATGPRPLASCWCWTGCRR